MSATNQPGAVVIGGDFQALGVVRSLAERGVPVFLLEYERGITRFSRHVRRWAIKDDLVSSDDGVEFLLQLADRQGLGGWVLLPNSDETVKFLAVNHPRLAERFRVAVPPWEITQQFYFKEQAYEIAERIGVPIPRMYRADSVDELLAQEIEFPVVLKPSCKENYYEKTNKKAHRANTPGELARCFTEMTELIPASQVVVQVFVAGGPNHLYSYATVFDGGRPMVGMSARRSRQHPMDFGHATTYAESVELPELEALATRLLTAMNYRGVAEVEFMYDEPSRTYKFLEINGRMWGWHTLAKAAGVNIPYAVYQLMTNAEIAPVKPQVGVKWIRLITDTPTVLGELVRGRMSLVHYLRSFRGPLEDAVFSWRDPLPFIMEILMIPYLWWKKGF